MGHSYRHDVDDKWFICEDGVFFSRACRNALSAPTTATILRRPTDKAFLRCRLFDKVSSH